MQLLNSYKWKRRPLLGGLVIGIFSVYLVIRGLNGNVVQNYGTDCSLVQKDRLRRLSENCGTVISSGDFLMPTLEEWLKQAWTVMVLEEQKAVLCLVPKVASSFWKVKILTDHGVLKENDFAGRDTFKADKPLQEVLSEYGVRSLVSYTQEEAKHILDTYHKVLFSRHPLERLFSAYRSKMTMADGVSKYYTNMASIIARGNNTGRGSSGRMRLPTIEQFAEFVARGKPNEYDLHWKRVVDVCNPCGVAYDFVGKLETMKEDSTCVLSELGMKPWFPRPPEMRVSRSAEVNILPPELLTKLRNIFRPDYDLFGYAHD